MYILTFFLMVALLQFATNRILDISDENNISYYYSRQDSFLMFGLFIFGVVLQLLPLKGHKIFWVAIIFYAFIIFTVMIVMMARKRIIITKQREEIQRVFEILEPVLPKNMELNMNNPPFKLEYEKNLVNKIIININPNTFKEPVAVNLCLSFNKYLPNFEWINELDYADRTCSFVGTPLPPAVAKYPGSWLRPAEIIPIGLSGEGEVSWTINSTKSIGRSCYIYEDGKVAKTVDIPSAPQALCIGSPLGLNTIIPTTKGYKTMGTITTDDYVFGYGNKPVKVEQVYAIKESENTYILAFVDAENHNIIVISDEEHRFPVIANNKITPTHCKDLDTGNLIAGPHNNYLLISKVKTKNKPVRCIRVASDEHLFLISNENPNWKGGNKYIYDAIYTSNTGGGKAIFINQEVEIHE